MYHCLRVRDAVAGVRPRGHPGIPCNAARTGMRRRPPCRFHMLVLRWLAHHGRPGSRSTPATRCARGSASSTAVAPQVCEGGRARASPQAAAASASPLAASPVQARASSAVSRAVLVVLRRTPPPGSTPRSTFAASKASRSSTWRALAVVAAGSGVRPAGAPFGLRHMMAAERKLGQRPLSASVCAPAA